MKKLLYCILFFSVFLIVTAAFAETYTLDWKNNTSSIVTADRMRNIAYNPKTGHLLIAVSAPLPIALDTGVYIIDAENGNILGILPNPADPWPDRTPYGLDVTEDGVIYATAGFWTSEPEIRIYRWADEASAPTIAASLSASEAAYIRSLRVVGTGTNTKIILSQQYDPQKVRILGTTDGLNFSVEDEFIATDKAYHGAEPWSHMTTIYTCRGGASDSYVYKWNKTSGGWVEDPSWVNNTPFICDLSLSEAYNTLYGAWWDITQGIGPERIFVFNATNGSTLSEITVGESGSSSVTGCYVHVYDGKTVKVEPEATVLTVGNTKQFSASADLARKLYFAFCGGVGYGRYNISANISGPVWSSSDTTIATVDTTGLVTAVGPGTCTITATYTRDGTPYSGSAIVQVVATEAPIFSDQPSKVTYTRDLFPELYE